MKELRGGIIRLFEQGKSGHQIAKDMGLHPGPVNKIIKRYRETGSFEDRNRSGRPRTGLFFVEHFGGGSVLETPPVNRSVEEEFGSSLEQNPTRSY